MRSGRFRRRINSLIHGPGRNPIWTYETCPKTSDDVRPQGSPVGGLLERVSDPAKQRFRKVLSDELNCEGQSLAIFATRQGYAGRPAEIVRHCKSAPIWIVEQKHRPVHLLQSDWEWRRYHGWATDYVDVLEDIVQKTAAGCADVVSLGVFGPGDPGAAIQPRLEPGPVVIPAGRICRLMGG